MSAKFVHKPYSSKALNLTSPNRKSLFILAGLLTYSIFELPSHSVSEQWIEFCSKTLLFCIE